MEKRNFIYWLILVVMCIGLIIVGTLILKKRAAIITSPKVKPAVQANDTKPIDSYIPDRPWRKGDPEPKN